MPDRSGELTREWLPRRISLVRYPCNRQDCVANEACLCRHHMVRSMTFDAMKCKKFRQRSKK